MRHISMQLLAFLQVALPVMGWHDAYDSWHDALAMPAKLAWHHTLHLVWSAGSSVKKSTVLVYNNHLTADSISCAKIYRVDESKDCVNGAKNAGDVCVDAWYNIAPGQTMAVGSPVNNAYNPQLLVYCGDSTGKPTTISSPDSHWEFSVQFTRGSACSSETCYKFEEVRHCLYFGRCPFTAMHDAMLCLTATVCVVFHADKHPSRWWPDQTASHLRTASRMCWLPQCELMKYSVFIQILATYLHHFHHHLWCASLVGLLGNAL